MPEDDKQVRIITANFNGKPIAFSSETVFTVEVGRHVKGAYKRRYSIKADLAKAVFYFNCINIGCGYKKRLMMSGSKKPLARLM